MGVLSCEQSVREWRGEYGRRSGNLFNVFISKNDFLISKNHFLISENHFLISENHFLISEIHFWYQKTYHFLISKNHFLISEIHFLISENIFWYKKTIIFWYQKIIFWYKKIQNKFPFARYFRVPIYSARVWGKYIMLPWFHVLAQGLPGKWPPPRWWSLWPIRLAIRMTSLNLARIEGREHYVFVSICHKL